jgi:hypothetical protein
MPLAKIHVLEGQYDEARQMNNAVNASKALNWDVFVTPGIPTVTSDLAPGTKQQMWSPISSTLIKGRRPR